MLTRARLREKAGPVARKAAGIGDPIRVSIVYLLAHDPLMASEIVAHVGLSQNLVAHHLTILYRLGWVGKEKHGRRVVYALKEKCFFELFRLLEGTPFSREKLSEFYKIR